MKIETPPGFIGMSVTHNEFGEIEEITFFNQETGFGSLELATVYEARPRFADPAIEVIHYPALATRLLDLIEDRTGLSAIADYNTLLLDDDGLPAVYEMNLHCKSCGHSWQVLCSSVAPVSRCPVCASKVETLRAATLWAGPTTPTLAWLWNWLPLPGARRFELASGLTIVETPEGFIATDALRNRLVIRTAVAGLRQDIICGLTSQKRIITVSPAGVEMGEVK